MAARAPGSGAQGGEQEHAAATGLQSSAAAWVETDGAAPVRGSAHRPLLSVAHQPAVTADPALLPLLRALARIARRCAGSAEIASARDAVGAHESGERS
jgi:hypothetical protein